MRIFDEYQGNAWGRRVVRDYPKMPRAMRGFFVMNHYVSKCSLLWSLIFLVATLVCMLKIVSGTWLTGDDALISESPWLILMVLLFTSSGVVRWIIPGLLNFTFYHWYRSARPKF